MRAILFDQPGNPEVLYLGEQPDPVPGAQELLVRVRATALNRADLLQRKGHYPPPPGESPILGLEIAGEVVQTGEDVVKWKPGDRICGLVGGGGYAELALIHESMALPIPEGMGWEAAAAIPEAFLTAWQALIWLGNLHRGESVLIHAGASGVGTAAIQLAREWGVEEIWTTASAPKHDLCCALGATHAIDYRNEDFAERILQSPDKGVHLIIDCIGAPYFQKNLQALKLDGRMVMLAVMGGAQLNALDLMPVLRKRLRIQGSTLRNRSLDYKSRLSLDLFRFAWPLFEDGSIQPVIDRVFPLAAAAEAHAVMEANLNQGKLILAV